MISLSRANISDELRAKIQARTDRFMALLAAGDEIPPSLEAAYRDPEVKAILRQETADKCAYCESKVTHTDYGDVEHIIPKTVRPNLRFVIENLTFACGKCNTNKGSYFDPDIPLLNPYVDDPSEHLIAMGPMVLRKSTSDRALVTEKKLKLNRPELVERRIERIEAIANLADQAARTSNASIRQVLLNQLRLECRNESEFSFTVRAFVDKVNESLNA